MKKITQKEIRTSLYLCVAACGRSEAARGDALRVGAVPASEGAVLREVGLAVEDAPLVLRGSRSRRVLSSPQIVTPSPPPWVYCMRAAASVTNPPLSSQWV